MTSTVNGQEWEVVDVELYKARPKGDGDTVWLLRKRLDYLGDDIFWITDPDHKSHRLAWVDTPERGEEGYSQADADLDNWIIDSLFLGPLKAIVYGSAGWDRLLVDVLNANGESASQYLMIEKGWPMYEKG